MASYDTSNAVWDWLVSTFRAETAVGHRNTGILDVRKGLQLWTQAVPAMGVQLMSSRRKTYATNKDLLTHEFVIVVGVKSLDSTSPTGFPNLDDANQHLVPLLSDGAGNGIIAILDYDITVGGLANTSRITRIDYQQEIRDIPASEQAGQVSDVWAYAFITFETEHFVTI